MNRRRPVGGGVHVYAIGIGSRSGELVPDPEPSPGGARYIKDQQGSYVTSRLDEETLQKLGLWDAVQDRLVMGENIGQTLQFTATGAADLGFVAMSQTIKDNKPVGGSSWAVPQALYSPIRQDAVILANPQDKAAAAAFVAYLKGPKARGVIQSYGYALP